MTTMRATSGLEWTKIARLTGTTVAGTTALESATWASNGTTIEATYGSNIYPNALVPPLLVTPEPCSFIVAEVDVTFSAYAAPGTVAGIALLTDTSSNIQPAYPHNVANSVWGLAYRYGYKWNTAVTYTLRVEVFGSYVVGYRNGDLLASTTAADDSFPPYFPTFCYPALYASIPDNVVPKPQFSNFRAWAAHGAFNPPT